MFSAPCCCVRFLLALDEETGTIKKIDLGHFVLLSKRCTRSFEGTLFLTLLPQFVINSISGRKMKSNANLVWSLREFYNAFQLELAACISREMFNFHKSWELKSHCKLVLLKKITSCCVFACFRTQVFCCSDCSARWICQSSNLLLLRSFHRVL